MEFTSFRGANAPGMEGDVYIKLKLVTVEVESKLLFICKATLCRMYIVISIRKLLSIVAYERFSQNKYSIDILIKHYRIVIDYRKKKLISNLSSSYNYLIRDFHSSIEIILILNDSSRNQSGCGAYHLHISFHAFET